MTLPRILTIMGSGETAPTMVTTHRRLTSMLPKPVKAVVLDTPYGFQENAPELASRAVDYFATSVNVDIAIAGLTRVIDGHFSVDPLEVERGLNTLTDADYVFAGPGSPTYALRQWAGSRVPALKRASSVCRSSTRRILPDSWIEPSKKPTGPVSINGDGWQMLKDGCSVSGWLPLSSARAAGCPGTRWPSASRLMASRAARSCHLVG